MSFRLEDIPTIESAGRLGRKSEFDSLVSEAYGSAHLEGDIVLGSRALTLGLEFADLIRRKVAPSAAQLATLQPMGAVGASYTTHSGCGGFEYNGTCQSPCFGFAPHHMDPFYCATCAEQAADPINNPSWNWHFVGSRGSIQYKDMEPDACAGRDAWKWKVGPCGDCAENATFRCHDGYKKYPNENYWDPTICEGLIVCDDNLTLC
jgi:hypothetical protein